MIRSGSGSDKRRRARRGDRPRRAAVAAAAILAALASLAAGAGPANAALVIDRDMILGGARTGENAGAAVAVVGDCNGDGEPDFLVGAPLAGFPGPLNGRARLYFGGAGADSVPDLVLAGEAAGDRFGYAVAGAGDVNGDGYDDFLIGAPGWEPGDGQGADWGRVYVFFGGDPDGPAPPDSLPDLVLSGEAAGDEFGRAVAGLGDLDGDGFADLGVGAPRWDRLEPPAENIGRAYVFLGGDPGGPAPPDAVPDWVLTGTAPGDYFGWSIAGLGDVDGDLAPDVGVSSLLRSAAYVFWGGDPAGAAPPDDQPDLVLQGESSGDRFGYAMAGAGDVNGDGLADVLVGALLNDAGGPDAGRAYVFRGRAERDTVAAAAADRVFTGAAAGDWFGRAVAGVGDLDQDGYGEVLVGAPSLDVDATSPGRAYLFRGGPDGGEFPAAMADAVFAGAAAQDRFGHAVAGWPGASPDGARWLLVGAPLGDAAQWNCGLAAVLRVAPPDSVPPGAVAGLAAAPGAESITVSWQDPADPDLARLEVWRARWDDGFGQSAYPWYDDASGSSPPVRPASRSAAAADPRWSLVGEVDRGVQAFADADTALAARGCYFYEVFARDRAGNDGPPAAAAARALSYVLGDLAQPWDGSVDSLDVALLAPLYGAAAGDTAFAAEVDVGPTDTGGPDGIPATDGRLDFEDVMILALAHAPAGPGEPAGETPPPVALAWELVDPQTWALRLTAPYAGLKGLSCRVALAAGVTPLVTAGGALGSQASPVFLASARDTAGVEAAVAVLGAGAALLGDGELLRLILPAPARPGEPAVLARGLGNEPLPVSLQIVTAVPERPAATLAQNWPNPCNPRTTIAFELPRAQAVRLTIHRLDGGLVRTLAAGDLPAGPHAVVWDGRDERRQAAASGVYLYRLQTADAVLARRLVLLK